jgi:hypothetical protein
MRFDFKVYATCQGSFFTLLHAIQWHHTSKEMGFKSRSCFAKYVIIYGKVHTFYFWLNKGSMFDGPFPFFNKDLTWSQRSQEGSSECPKKECFKINHLRPSCPVSSQKGSRRAMPKTLMQDRIVSLPVGRRSPDFQVK